MARCRIDDRVYREFMCDGPTAIDLVQKRLSDLPIAETFVVTVSQDQAAASI
jgi:hypothetical protein